jgi:hypothetical protein
MRELLGTRSESEQGSYRARQRLHGLLRGVVVNAALVCAVGKKEGGVVVRSDFVLPCLACVPCYCR